MAAVKFVSSFGTHTSFMREPPQNFIDTGQNTDGKFDLCNIFLYAYFDSRKNHRAISAWEYGLTCTYVVQNGCGGFTCQFLENLFKKYVHMGVYTHIYICLSKIIQATIIQVN